MKATAVIAAASLGLVVGCASPVAQRAQRADGLIDFLAGNPGETSIPVEEVSGGGGRIATAQVRAYRSGVFVSGRVERASVGDPPPWSHVDVLVLDRRGKVIESTSTTYLPRDIPHGQRGAFPQSRFTARLSAIPPFGSIVRVRFHGIAKSECEFGEESRPLL